MGGRLLLTLRDEAPGEHRMILARLPERGAGTPALSLISGDGEYGMMWAFNDGQEYPHRGIVRYSIVMHKNRLESVEAWVCPYGFCEVRNSKEIAVDKAALIDSIVRATALAEQAALPGVVGTCMREVRRVLRGW